MSSPVKSPANGKEERGGRPSGGGGLCLSDEEGQIQGEGIVVYSSTDRGRKRSESMIFMAEGASQGAAVQLGVGGHARDVHVVQDESTDVGAMQGSDSLQYQYSELSAGLKKTADKVDSQHAKPCATLRRNECACVCVCL